MELQTEQKLILTTTNKDIIVSAGAGSGKTFVMIEKILDNIISNKVLVTQLLVVTFTNAAASEMRQKLEKRLREHLSTLKPDTPDYNFILQQINLLPQSNICTLHKFCQNVISKYFYALDIDTGFSILEDTDVKLLQNKAIEEVIQKLEKTEEEGVVDLLYIYDNKRDNRKIKDIILKVYNYLQNQTDILGFKQKVLSSYSAPLDNNIFANIINEHIIERFDFYAKSFAEFIKTCTMLDAKKLLDCAIQCQNVALLFKKENTFTQNLHILFSTLTTLPKLSKAPDELKDMQEEFKLLKTEFSKEISSLQEKCVCDNPELLYQDLLHNQQIMEGVFTLTQRFAKAYDTLKRKRNVVDFSDLEHFCMQILQNEDIAQEVKQSFVSVYVDEYQDINDIQENIISRVSTEGNLFLVGDVKQSIYGFRNTNPQIFINKVDSFSKNPQHKASILLNCNFRSDQRVLDFVNLVFSRLMTNSSAEIDYLNTSLMASDRLYKVETDLPSVEIDLVNTHKDEKKEKQQIQSVYSVKDAVLEEKQNLDIPKTEADIIADKIFDLKNKQKQIFDPKLGKEGGLRDITWGDIAILCQSRSSALSALLARLKERGVPVQDFGGEDIFNTYEIQVLYSYLKLINNQQDDINLATMLTSPIINLTEAQLLAIKNSNKESKCFYECLGSVTDKQILNKIELLNNLIKQGKNILINGTIYDCLNQFIITTNYLSIISLLSEGQKRVDNVNSFVNGFVGKSYNTCLYQFINFVETNNNQLDIRQETNAGSDIVTVTTMHHSKGLEYPIVFLVNLGHKFNFMGLRDEIVFYDKLGVGLYAYDYEKRIKRNTLSRSAIILKLKQRALAENLRLLYVAMTRAKNNLYIVGGVDVNNFAPAITDFDLCKTENFLELVLSSLKQTTLNLQNNQNTIVSAVDYRNNTIKPMFNLCVYPVTLHSSRNSEILTNPIKLSNYTPEFEQLLNNLADFKYKFNQSTVIGLKNSVTKLNQEELNISNPTNINEQPKTFNIAESNDTQTSADLGTIYHHAMQVIDFNLDSTQQIYQFLQDKLNISELNLIDCGKILACVRELRPIINGADAVLREQPFMMYVPHNQIVEGGVEDKILIQGVIDLIVVKGDNATIIDYKLTSIKNPAKLKQKYATQLKCYAYATQNALGKNVSQKILYSFLQEMQIIVWQIICVLI